MEIFVDDSDIRVGDSGVFRRSADGANLCEVYEAGKLTVIGFEGRNVPSDFWLGQYNSEFLRMVEEYNCEELAVDLTGVEFIPTGLLGLISSLRQNGVMVSLYNPSPDVCAVLKAVELDGIIPTHQVEIS